jgi:hypothetical protein
MNTLAMKTIITLPLFLFVITTYAQTNTFPSSGAAGIGTTSPNASSLFEVKSTSKGVLIPRMTQKQRNAIISPATGLLIYQTDNTPGFYYFNGASWTAVSKTSKAWNLAGNAGTTASNFIGTTDAHSLTMKVNNQKSGYIDFTSPYKTSFGYQNLTAAFGNANSAFGYQALFTDTSGSNNTATGFQALYNTSMGSFNTATGVSAMYKNSTGNYNTASGFYALFSNVDGYSNTASGYYAMYANNYGHGNSAFGTNALNSNTTAIYNSAFGYAALYSNSTGNYNTASGAAALYNNNGSYNTAAGFEAMRLNNESYNTAFGYQALRNTTASQYNLAVGYNAGYSLDNGYNNVFLGANTDVNGIGYYNVIAIGQATVCTAPSQVTMGNSATNSYRAYANWTNISDGRYKKNVREDVPGLKFINKLKAVTYTLDATGIDNFLHRNSPPDKQMSSNAKAIADKALKEKEQIRYTGFIAQEVEKVTKEIGYNFSGVDAPKNENDFYGLRYAEFVVPLVKAVQELSSMNDDKTKAITDLKSQLADQQKQINELKALIAGQNSTLSLMGGSASLEQNMPNPFNGKTTIGYTLPGKFATAQIAITDKSGNVVKQLNVSGTGKGTVQVDLSSLVSGSYYYSLYVDGKLIDSKPMVQGK